MVQMVSVALADRNVLKPRIGYRPLIASGLIDTLKKQWADAWGARMEHLLRYAILALLEQPKADIRDIVRLFVEKDFRRAVIGRISDPQVYAFWTKEFPNMNYKNAADGVAPIANKLGAFLANPVLRKAMCEAARDAAVEMRDEINRAIKNR